MDLAPRPDVFLRGVAGGDLPELSLVSVTDDSESVRWAVARAVGSAGFGVEVFARAGEFIRSDQRLGTACLILDVQLPGMSGLLQSDWAAVGRHMPMIFVTASEKERTPVRSESGCRGGSRQEIRRQIFAQGDPPDLEIQGPHGRTNLHAPGRSC